MGIKTDGGPAAGPAGIAARLAELERANAELESFAELAAHELLEPVRKLQMFGDLLKPGSGSTPAETAEYAGLMQDAARRMGRLVSDILAYSRARSAAAPFEPVPLGEAAAAAAADSPELSEAGSLELGPLPTVRGDRAQLKQLFAGLLSNAVKFRRPDVPLRVTVRTREGEAGAAAVEVSDDGIGFEPAHAASIFEPFKRLHRRTDYPGSGLGLALCARIAARHGGSVSARAVPGKGAVFTVVLPLNGGE